MLEIGCGTGRVLIPTARAGVRIIGLDASASMLGVCARRLELKPAIRRHLIPGGRLILDLFNPSIDYLANRPMGEEAPDGEPFSTPDGRTVRRTSRIVTHDRFAQVTTVELIYYVTHPGGREKRMVHAFGMRYLWPYEAAHLLVRAGFSVEHLYAD